MYGIVERFNNRLNENANLSKNKSCNEKDKFGLQLGAKGALVE